MAGTFSASTFRTVGNAATTQVLFTIENIDPTKLVYIRRLNFLMDTTVLLATFMPLIKTSRTIGVPTGGTAISKGLFDTANTSNANTILRGCTASDGGALTEPVASPGTIGWVQEGSRLHSAVGQVLAPDNNLLPLLVEDKDFILRQNEAIMVQVVAFAGTSNPATNHYVVEVVWDEN